MERQRQPFNANPDTGKLGYRNPEFEPYPDERPVIYWPHSFWKDEEERERYERSAKLCPVSASGSLTLDQYLAAIVELAEGIRPRAESVKSMPTASVGTKPWPR